MSNKKIEPKFPNYRGCYAKFHKKSVRHYLDMDYLDKLTSEEKEFLGQFCDEFYSARFSKEKPPLHDMSTVESRRKIYGPNNSRNVDVMNVRNNSVDRFSHINEVPNLNLTYEPYEGEE